MTGYSEQTLIPEMVAMVATRSPESAALTEGDRVLSYGSLHERANQVAHFLLSRGVKAEDKIGLLMGRSIDFVIAALGVLKSGAAYVPLDPSYPEARRRLIVEDAGLKVLLGEQPMVGTFSQPVETISLYSQAVQAQPTSDPSGLAWDADQLAYVIYTSGSTGTPKGVEVTHGNLRHLVSWHQNAFQVTSDDRATLLANVGFDAAIWELWPYLSAGAAVLIPAPEVVRQPKALRDYVVQSKVSVMFAPTLLAEVLMQLSWPEDLALRVMLTGGDILRTSPKDGLPFAVVNNYGPAECTVVSTSGLVTQSGHPKGIPSIGQAIAGASIVLLDKHLRPVGPGEQGEICIGGGGVARGYLNQPELTSQRFVTLPGDGARIYRSGDVGSWNEDGSLQFLGRVDQQVKIRGYRIECGEIESALNSLPSVQSSAVVVREQAAGHRALTAYLVAKDGLTLRHDELRQELRVRLPEYMIPEQFVRLTEMPLNENGKIDRYNLPVPAAANTIAAAKVMESVVESSLSTVLTKLLGVEHIERNDNFFLLGGHSFIAAQLIARIRDRFGVELGLRAVFENPTLAGMAEQIEQRMTVKA